MLRNIFFFFCFANIISILSSCSGDKFSQVVEVDLPEHKPLLSISAELSNLDSSRTIIVGRTWPTTERPNNPAVTDAVVKIYKNGSLFWNYNPSPPNEFYYTQDAGILEAGTTYRLEVSAPGFEPVFSEQTMPSLVTITKANLKMDGVITPDGDKATELTIEFDDPTGEGDYYGIRSFSHWLYFDSINMDTFEGDFDLSLDTFDPLLEYGPNGLLLISDKSFDGKKVKLKTFFYGYYPAEEGYDIVVHLVHITREQYLYTLSLVQYQDTHDNPFAEPVNVLSNIEGGVGHFNLEMVDTVHVRF
ncbi:MAG: DUF4249 family protein [Bacteroidetes bacterium]|nr:DUF4249 family protein [Bacteroidota bacterium]